MRVRHPVIRIQGLEVSRGAVAIVRKLDWTIHQGEHCVLLGANGSGKTSLLAALTAYLTPSAGSIELLGESYGAFDWRELRRRVGIVSTALTRSVPPSETALETVYSGDHAELGTVRRMELRHKARASRCLSLMGIRRLADRRWEVLSQGERQKVFIARALMPSPALLILDEPCAGLDPVARAAFLERLQKLAARKGGPSIVLVTHHVEEIVPAVTHALLLKSGRVLASGPIEETLTDARLTQAFGRPLHVLRDSSGRWSLEFPGS